MNTVQVNFEKPLSKELTDQDVAFLYNLGVRLFRLGQYNKTLSIFQLLVVYDQRNVIYLKSLAGCCQALSEFSRAAFLYQHAYALDNSSNDCLYYSGVCLLENSPTEAKALFEAYLSSEPAKPFAKKTKMYLTVLLKQTPAS